MAKSAASIWTEPAQKWSPGAYVTQWVSTGTRSNKQLYFSDNSRDWLSEDLPQDELNRVTKDGQHFGAPYCYQGNFPDPEFGWGNHAASSSPPVTLTGPHSAGLGLRFYTGKMFPAKYKNAIFLARHGSWNRTTKFGGDVIAIYLNKDGTVKIFGTVHYRLHRQQQLYLVARWTWNHGGRFDAAVRRLERSDLSHHLRQGPGCRPVTQLCGRGATRPGHFRS